MFDKSIEKMDFKELRSAVQVLYDAYVKLKRNYEDQIYNLDGDNFSRAITLTADGKKAQISITAEEVKTMLSDELQGYSTISQTALQIESAVHRGIDIANAIEVSGSEEFTNKNALYLLDGECYYYNQLTRKWEICGDSIYSVFNQTASGFQLKGDVLIDGNVISNASICGSSFSDSNGIGTLKIGSGTGFADLTFTSFGANHGTELFRIYEDANIATMYLFGHEVCAADSTGITFSDAIVKSPVAVFG